MILDIDNFTSDKGIKFLKSKLDKGYYSLGEDDDIPCTRRLDLALKNLIPSEQFIIIKLSDDYYIKILHHLPRDKYGYFGTQYIQIYKIEYKETYTLDKLNELINNEF